MLTHVVQVQLRSVDGSAKVFPSNKELNIPNVSPRAIEGMVPVDGAVLETMKVTAWLIVNIRILSDMRCLQIIVRFGERFQNAGLGLRTTISKIGTAWQLCNSASDEQWSSLKATIALLRNGKVSSCPNATEGKGCS